MFLWHFQQVGLETYWGMRQKQLGSLGRSMAILDKCAIAFST